MSKMYDAGITTAYGAAVRGGYEGTYEQFCTDLGKLADVLSEFLGFSVTVETLAEGAEARGEYDAGVLSLGIPRGDTGNGIQSIALNADYTLTVTYTNGQTWTSGSIRGETGATPNLQIGTVSTLSPGSPATAEITGTRDEPRLNLGIPQGVPGEVPAASIAPAYDASSTYAVGEYVMHNNSLYRCTTAITTAEAWTAAHWTAAQIGDDLADCSRQLSDLDEDVYTLNKFSFNDELTSKRANILLEYKRYGTAYDSNKNAVSSNTPIYQNFKLNGKNGIVIAPATKNLISASGSQSMTSAETISVTAGNYTLSLQGTTGYVTYANSDDTITGYIRQKGIAHFNFTSNDTLTITPHGTVDYVQFEKNIFKTPWNLGGANRYDGTITSSVNETLHEFGLGFWFKPFDASEYCKDNYMMLAYGRQDANNYFYVCWHKSSTTTNYHFEFRVVVNGVGYSIQSPWGGWEIKSNDEVIGDKIVFAPEQLIGLYAHLVPGREMSLYYALNGVVSVSTYYSSAIGGIPISNLFIGCGSASGSSDPPMIANGMFSDFVFDTEKPDPMKFFKGGL